MSQKQTLFWKIARISGLYVREILGWGLIGLGLWTFLICWQFLKFGGVIEGFIASIIGISVFRAGLQLVKVAVAARAVRASYGGTKQEDVQTRPVRAA